MCDTLKEVYKVKYKGVGCEYTRDEDRTLAADPRKYIDKILDHYKKPLKMFGEKPKKAKPPLEARDHPEKDLFEFCDQDQTIQFLTNDGE